jgi:eukaryotic-like serine/threonine-protein kinase
VRRYRKAAAALLVLGAVGALGAVLATRGANRPEPPKEDDPIVALRKQEVLRRVGAIRQTPPPPARTSPHPVVEVDELRPPNRTGFQLLDDERTVDMRAWRELAPGDDPRTCRVQYATRQRFLKTADVDTFVTEARTTGTDLVLRNLSPSPDASTVYAARKAGFVGQQAMKVRQLHIDVRKVPRDSEFDLRDEVTYYHSIQKREDQWFGVIGDSNAVKVAMLMLFPEAKPFRTYELKVAPTRQAPPQPFAGPVITFAGDDKSWLYWEIASPKAGFVYRVDWEW